MVKMITSITGGLVGAIALNVLHETVKRFYYSAPRVDLVGEEAITKLMKFEGVIPPKGNALYAATLASDVVSNALYYSLIGFGSKKNLLLRGAVYGVAAGAGALVLTKQIGLSDAPITRTNQTKVLTLGWYLFGGVITALAIKGFQK